MSSNHQVLPKFEESLRKVQTSLQHEQWTRAHPHPEDIAVEPAEAPVELHGTDQDPALDRAPVRHSPVPSDSPTLRRPARFAKHTRADGSLPLHRFLVSVVAATDTVRLTPSFTFITYALLLFLCFFVAERLLWAAVLLPQLHWLSHRPLFVQVLSFVAAVAGAGVLFPKLQAMAGFSAFSWNEHARFLAAAESSLDDFYIFDGILDASGTVVDFRFNYLNPNAERRLNTKRETLRGKILTEVRPFMISSGLIENYREVVRTGVPITVEVFIDDERIRATWLRVQVVKLGNGIAITSRDITESKRLAERVSFLAYHDQLTGLANRALLQDRLQQAIHRAQREKQKVAVFVLDIDHFKRVNDSLGHADGDALLSSIGERLRSCTRETDTVARLGGDEFVIVMPDFKTLDDVMRSGEQIIERTARPITLSGREIKITISMGFCIYPDGGLEAEQLLKHADAAMYQVKRSGRNGLLNFSESVTQESPGSAAHQDS